MITRPAPTERPAPVPGSPRGVRGADRESWFGPLGIAAMVVSLAFLLAGIVWPQAAEALLRLLLATLAAAFVVIRAFQAMLPTRTTHDAYSPFDGDTTAQAARKAPHLLRKFTAELGAADDDRSARRAAIPRSVRWTVIEEASRRLAEHHGLKLSDPGHHERIRSLVSEPTWLVIAPRDRESRADTRPATRRRRVPLSRLDRILDDLEGL